MRLLGTDEWTRDDIDFLNDKIDLIESNTGAYAVQMQTIINRLNEIRTTTNNTYTAVQSIDTSTEASATSQAASTGGISYLAVSAFAILFYLGWMIYGEYAGRSGADAPSYSDRGSR